MECVADTGSELLLCGPMGSSSNSAVAGDHRVFLKRQRSRHDLTVDCPDRQGIKGPLTCRRQPSHQLLGPLGCINRATIALLDQPYLLGKASPLIEKAQKLPVDCIDGIAKLA